MADPAAPKQKREKKAPFTVPFVAKAGQYEAKTRLNEIFEAPKKANMGILQPKAINHVTRREAKPKKGQDKQNKRSDHLLPPDEHFSAKSLVNLFLKPQFAVSILLRSSFTF